MDSCHVNTGEKLNNEDQTRLNKHLQLAKELGAEVITTDDLDVATALQRIARQKSITRLVIGRPTRAFFFSKIIYKSIIDRLEEENKQMDILILRQDKLVSLYKKVIPTLEFTSSFLSYWIVLGAGFFITLFGYFLTPLIGYKAVGYIFLVGILILSLFVGQGPILLAATLSALSWDYLFIPPVFNLIIKDPNDIVLVVIYFFVALVVGMLNTRIRQRDLFLYRREEKIEHLYEVMQEIAKSANFQYLRLNVDAKLKALFGGEFDILVKGADNQLVFDSQIPILKEETDRAAALWSYRTAKMAGWSTDTLPSAKALYFPIKFSKVPIGVLVCYIKDYKPFSMDETNFLQAVTDQLGIFLERYVFEERVQSQNYVRQVEKLHNAIFRSLSKGFYAPLEKMFFINQKFKELAHNREEEKLAQEMDRAGKNLKMIVDNILTISELESGFIQFEKQKYSVKNLIEEALQEVKLLINEHPIRLQLPDQDFFFDFDFKLMKSALKNVLLNAFEYSPANTPITIGMEVLETEFKISVIDEGPGIPKDMIPFIFEKFYRLPGSKLEGIGLGLTIVKSVIDLHQGRLEVKDLEGKGNGVFVNFA